MSKKPKIIKLVRGDRLVVGDIEIERGSGRTLKVTSADSMRIVRSRLDKQVQSGKKARTSTPRQ